MAQQIKKLTQIIVVCQLLFTIIAIDANGNKLSNNQIGTKTHTGLESAEEGSTLSKVAESIGNNESQSDDSSKAVLESKEDSSLESESALQLGEEQAVPETSPEKAELDPAKITTTPTPTDDSAALKPPDEPAQPKEEPNKPEQVDVPKKTECDEETLCLNDGYCVVLENGQEKCICPEAFYGERCEYRNICKSVVADNLTGNQICNRIGRACVPDEKVFRCDCGRGWYFVFKPDHFKHQEETWQPERSQHQHQNNNKDCDGSTTTVGGQSATSSQPERTTFAYDAMLALVNQQDYPMSVATSDGQQQQTPGGAKRLQHLAECRQVNKCIGVRCRQLSEVCDEGECKCNQDAGYIRDPRDNLCKLLNPCNLPRPEGQPPICGGAKCLPTYNKDLFRCVCPIGYYAIQRGAEKSSIQCTILSDFICSVPMLNKCQHNCRTDRERGSYKCSCLPGYKPGKRAGIDDHMCFFEEHFDGSSASSSSWHSMMSEKQLDDPDGVYDDQQQRPRPRRHIAFKTIERSPVSAGLEPELDHLGSARSSDRKRANDERLIQRIVVFGKPRETADIERHKREASVPLAGGQYDQGAQLKAGTNNQLMNDDDDDEDDDSMNTMSAQERCNMFCDDNKICVLEDEATGSYRCVCDRQGYVSVGDKCLDWCAAAEFNNWIKFLLDLTCVTGLCKRLPSSEKQPPSNFASMFYSYVEFTSLPADQQLLVKLEARSSWRPTFQCDCSVSPLVYEDPVSHLCKLNFDAILNPCLPGSPGHTDCVINKHAYCAVLHKDPLLHKRGSSSSQIMEQIIAKGTGSSSSLASSSGAANKVSSKTDSRPNPTVTVNAANSSFGGKKATEPENELYVCVCPPEKKFLVDGPRKKTRCVDECSLLSNECGRFNRMCREASINSTQFGLDSLVFEDHDGARVNQFKRTDCECLPGFNVGPSEMRDLTTINSSQPDDSAAGSSFNPGSPRPHRFGWDTLEDPLRDATITVNDPPAVDQNVIQSDFEAVIQEIEQLRTRYMNINSRCLLDYDVVEFQARFKAPADFEPTWVNSTCPDGQPATNNKGGFISKRPIGSASQPSQHQATIAGKLASAQNEHEGERSGSTSGDNRFNQQESSLDARILKVPSFMYADISEFYKHIVLVADCDYLISKKSFEAYEHCVKYRYWAVQKFRAHFFDWRKVMAESLRQTFDLMDGNIHFRVNNCEAKIQRVTSVPSAYAESMASKSSLLVGLSDQKSGNKQDKGTESASNLRLQTSNPSAEMEVASLDPWDQYARVDADLDCHLTIHSASGNEMPRKRVLLEKQLLKFIYTGLKFSKSDVKQQGSVELLTSEIYKENDRKNNNHNEINQGYFLMAPNTLIHRETIDESAAHRKPFSPCKSKYSYCDKQTRCEMQDPVNYSCTCEFGYTPIGSRDIYFRDSRKQVCEDIDECLFDVCSTPELEGKSTCVNEIGDYKCLCNRNHVGDNKRYCDHICNVINCKHGDCRVQPNKYHAYCECYEGYRDSDCSVQDPSVALRKANMIICSSIFASVLLLAITLAISLNSQLKKAKKKLKRLEAAQEAVEFYEFSLQQPPYRHRVSRASITS